MTGDGVTPDFRALLGEEAWGNAFNAFHMALDSQRGGTGVALMAFFDSLVESGVLHIEYRTAVVTTAVDTYPQPQEQRLVGEWRKVTP